MKLMFIGADHEVTGSCHYLQIAGKHILVDYGMEQGRDVFQNAELPVPEAMIDYVFLTHAHIDHSGLLPLLSARGFQGRIYATDATAHLCGIMLRDCAHIQMQEAEWRSRKGKRNRDIAQTEPLYTMQDADNAIRAFVPCPYDRLIEVCDGIRLRFTDIGHLLGSASIEVFAKEGETERKIVFSGDIGNYDQPIIRDPKKTETADYVVMESTYGDRLHAEERPDYVGELTEILNRTFARGGNVVIPSFAVGRTQEMLYFLRQIKERRLVTAVEDFAVYVDSPLAVDATDIFSDHYFDCFDEEAMELVRQGIDPITFPGLRLTITAEESRMINFDPAPKVIISASGMCDAGRIKHHLKHNLWRPESTILFVGYQSVGTPGRSIVDGAEQIKIFGEPVDVAAEIARLKGISGHADKNGLIDWIGGFKRKPEKVFIVHGEDSVTMNFAKCLREEYGLDAYAPYSGTEFDLISGEFLMEAQPVAVRKKIFAVTDIFAKLQAAGERLLKVIEKCRGMSNKDLERFAGQINALADQWDAGEP